MPTDLYQIPSTDEAEPTAESTEPEEVEDDSETESEPTALLPKSILGEVKAGDSVTLKVVHIYEDEVEVEKQGAESEDEGDEYASVDKAIDSMATEEED
jgi:hypothetical protein